MPNQVTNMTLRDFSGELRGLADQLTSALGSKDYSTALRTKQQYEALVTANPRAVSSLQDLASRTAKEHKTDIAALAGFLPAQLKTSLGEQYNFDTNEDNPAFYQARYGLNPTVSTAIARTRYSGGQAVSDEDVAIASAFNVAKEKATSNGAVGAEINNYLDAVKTGPLRDLPPDAASSLYRMSSSGGLSLGATRALFDDISRRIQVSGVDKPDPSTRTQAVLGVLSGLQDELKGPQMAYALRGFKAWSDARPGGIPDTELRTLGTRLAAWAATDRSDNLAQQVAQNQGITDPEKVQQLTSAARAYSMNKAGLLPGNSPAVVTAQKTVANLLGSRDGLDLTSTEGRTAIYANVQRLRGGKALSDQDKAAVDDLAVQHATITNTRQAFPEAGLAMPFGNSTSGRITAKAMYSAFASPGKDASGADLPYTRDQLRQQQSLLAARRGEADAAGDTVLVSRIDEYLAKLKPAVAETATEAGAASAEAKLADLSKRFNVPAVSLRGDVTTIKATVEKAFADRPMPWIGAQARQAITGGATTETETSAARWYQKAVVKVGGAEVPLSDLVPLSEEELVNLNDPRKHVAVVDSARLSRTVDEQLARGAFKYDAEARTLKFVGSALGRDKGSMSTEGSDVRNPATAPAVAGSFFLPANKVSTFTTDLADYSKLQSDESAFVKNLREVGGRLGVPNVTPDMLVTGIKSPDKARQVLDMASADALLLTSGGDADAVRARMRAGRLEASTAAAQQMAQLSREKMAMDQWYREQKLQLDTRKASAQEHAQLEQAASRKITDLVNRARAAKVVSDSINAGGMVPEDVRTDALGQ